MAKVNMEDLRPNSYKYRNQPRQSESKERKKLEPIVDAKNVKTSKSLKRKKVVKTFFEEDMEELKRRMLWEVIIPGAKDWAMNFASMLIMREPYRGGFGSRTPGTFTNNRQPYSSFYRSSNGSNNANSHLSRYDESILDYRNIVLTNRYDAECVVKELYDRIQEYGYASVADLYDLLRIPSKFTDESWGWTDERDIRVTSTRDGYLIDVRDAGKVGR